MAGRLECHFYIVVYIVGDAPQLSSYVYRFRDLVNNDILCVSEGTKFRSKSMCRLCDVVKGEILYLCEGA